MAFKAQFSGTAMITGALCEVGEKVALGFASQGCTSIFLADIAKDDGALAQLAKRVQEAHPGTRCHHQVVPSGQDEDSIVALVEKCVAMFGGIDYAVNIAQKTTEHKTVLETSEEEFDHYLDNTAIPVFFYQQNQIRSMMKKAPSAGSIVNVSSVLGLATTSTAFLEATGQHSVIGFTRSAALDCASLGIRVNGVCPGPLETLVADFPTIADSEVKKMPSGKLCKVDDVVGPIMFLSSDSASGISGHCLPVDGGWMLRHV